MTKEVLEIDEWDLLEIDSSFNQPTGNTEATKTSISLEIATALIKAYSSNVNILESQSTELIELIDSLKLVKYKHVAKVGHIDQKGFILDVTNAYNNHEYRVELDTDILRVIPSLLVWIALLNMSFSKYLEIVEKVGLGEESHSLFWAIENFSEEWKKQPLALRKALIAYAKEDNK